MFSVLCLYPGIYPPLLFSKITNSFLFRSCIIRFPSASFLYLPTFLHHYSLIRRVFPRYFPIILFFLYTHTRIYSFCQYLYPCPYAQIRLSIYSTPVFALPFILLPKYSAGIKPGNCPQKPYTASRNVYSNTMYTKKVCPKGQTLSDSYSITASTKSA